MTGSHFGAKLDLVLKAFSMSRAQLAADLSVDKSLVGRWVAGAVSPSAHNLAALTRYVAVRTPGFTMLDWDREMGDFARLFGVAAPVAAPEAVDGVPLPLMGMVRASTADRAADLECFFRTTRPAEAAPGRFMHDQGMVRAHPNGLLEFRMGVRETVYQGWLLPVRGQLFCIATDDTNGALVYALFSSVPPGKVQRLDGISLGGGNGSLPGVTAAPIVLDRFADLSGDREADDRRYRELLGQDPLAPEGSIPADVLTLLSRDFGPSQLAAGGDWLLTIPFHRSLSRGVVAADQSDAPAGGQVIRPDFGRPPR